MLVSASCFGECPKFDENRTIKASFTVRKDMDFIRFSGSNCKDSETCEYMTRDGCPLTDLAAQKL